ncbi:histone H1-like [Teleopsis dalmanni]|uniref:histone H1-like n=1 Tax=Teleopsis dalmanni TaxID=139649 RepID=UPI000D32BE48|nr:histone H1-like [Teleopsis dalmanni]
MSSVIQIPFKKPRIPAIQNRQFAAKVRKQPTPQIENTQGPIKRLAANGHQLGPACKKRCIRPVTGDTEGVAVQKLCRGKKSEPEIKTNKAGESSFTATAKETETKAIVKKNPIKKQKAAAIIKKQKRKQTGTGESPFAAVTKETGSETAVKKNRIKKPKAATTKETEAIVKKNRVKKPKAAAVIKKQNNRVPKKAQKGAAVKTSKMLYEALADLYVPTEKDGVSMQNIEAYFLYFQVSLTNRRLYALKKCLSEGVKNGEIIYTKGKYKLA